MGMFSTNVEREDSTCVNVEFTANKLDKFMRILTPFDGHLAGKLEFDFEDRIFKGHFAFPSEELTDVFFASCTMELPLD